MSDTILKHKMYFQPTDEVLKKWLETRKVDFFSLAGGRVKPFFSDVGVKEDRFWFMLAMAIELAGLAATIYGGLRVGGKLALISILIVFALVILDLVVAKLIHKNEGELVWLRAEAEKKGFNSPNSNDYFKSIAILEEKEKKEKRRKLNFLILLIFMALIKLFGIFAVGAFSEPIVYYIFFALYMVTVYVHYKHTGYYLAYSGLLNIVKGVTNLYNKEYKNFLETKHNPGNKKTYEPQTYIQSFRTKYKLNKLSNSDDCIIEHNMGHKIVESIPYKNDNEKNTQGEGEYLYELNVRGIITDQEIIDLTNGQEKENVINIFMAGRTIQLEKYGVGTSMGGSSMSMNNIQNTN